MKPVLIGHDEGNRPIHLTEGDLETHVQGVGASRTGKSKLIEAVARQLTLDRGTGFCLIDPHGFLYKDMLRWLAYMQPRREILFINPSSAARIVGFNPFKKLTGDPGARVQRVVQVMLKAWGQTNSDETPRLERWLRCVGHVMVEGGYTIEASRYLVSWDERRIRDELVRRVKGALIQQEWEELRAYKRLPDFNLQLESTKNRLFRFLDSLPIRRMMGLSTNCIDLEDVIEKGKILLVNLQPSEDITEEQSKLIGALLISEIWEAARRRKQGPGGRPPIPPFHLIVDEFHEFLTPTIPHMLTAGAKYGLHLWLFHQNFAQLREREAEILGALDSARLKLVFGGLGREDARYMVENIFPKQIDLTRIKYLVHHTKFWPVYRRDKAYTRTRACAEGSGGSFGSGSHSAWDPSSQAFIELTSSADSQTRTSTVSVSESEADIPTLYPVPFDEPTPVLYSLEELLWELTDRLVEQYQRHYFLRRPGEKTIAARTPQINPRFVRPERLEAYTESRLSGFLRPEEVDRAIDQMHTTLALEAGAGAADLEEGDFFTPLDARKVKLLK